MSALALPIAVSAPAHAQEGETVHCYGVNKCKETGDCGGPGHSCANQNACKRKGYIDKFIPHIGIALKDILDLSGRQETKVVSTLSDTLSRSRKM